MLEKIFLIKKCLTTLPRTHWTFPILFQSNKLPVVLPFLKKHHISVYGSPEFSWNCGRTGVLNLSYDHIKVGLKQFISLDVPCFLTFSNYFLTREHLSDKLGNYLLDCLSEGKENGVIVSNDTLYNYIRSNYPGLKLKCSILKSSYENFQHNMDWYKRMLDLFDIVVVHPDIPVDSLCKLPCRDRIEILINETCRKNCPNRRICYLPNMSLSKCVKDCDHNGGSVYSLEEIENFYVLGFRHFKVQGR